MDVVRDGDTGVNFRHSVNNSHVFKNEQFEATCIDMRGARQLLKAQRRHYAAPTLTLHLTGIVYFCIMILIIEEGYFSKQR